MVKTIGEFKDELKTMRKEIYRKGEYADPKLIASWVDRLIISLEGITPKLDLMMQDIEELNDAVNSMAGMKSKKKGGIKKKIKKAVKKVKKKIKSSKKKKR